jgi:pyruvate dehydrogenase E1 component
MPEGVTADDTIGGLYRFTSHKAGGGGGFVRLLGSGAILREALQAARLLEADWAISSEVWSVTSYSELARDTREAERRNRLHALDAPVTSRFAARLTGDAPIVAASDYVRAYPQLVASYIRAPTLGTDGFGRSDSRAALRAFFEVDRWTITITALSTLAERGNVEPIKVAEAIAKYGVDTTAESSWTH